MTSLKSANWQHNNQPRAGRGKFRQIKAAGETARVEIPGKPATLLAFHRFNFNRQPEAQIRPHLRGHMGIRNRFDKAAYEVSSELLDSDEPLIANRGMGIRAPRNRQPRQDTPEFFHSVPKLAWFLALKFPYAILPFTKLKMKCQCGPCTFPWHQAGRKILVRDCEFDPPCRACRDTIKMMDWAVVIVEWFLMHETDRDIEKEHRWKLGTVNYIVQRIRRQIRGERQDGLPRTGNPRGRPKRKIDTFCATVEIAGR